METALEHALSEFFHSNDLSKKRNAEKYLLDMKDCPDILSHAIQTISNQNCSSYLTFYYLSVFEVS
jgi:hypothetical protein